MTSPDPRAAAARASAQGATPAGQAAQQPAQAATAATQGSPGPAAAHGSPGPPATQGTSAAPTAQGAPGTQQAPVPTGSASARRAGRSGPSTWSTPARLRLARGLATAAALLTGVVATGTFDTSGVNPTPNVIAAQWVAGERAGTELAASRLEVARSVAETAAEVPQEQRSSDPGAFRGHLGEAEELITRSGAPTSGSLVEVALTGQSALDAQDGEAAATAYQEVVGLTDTALSGTDDVAAEHAHDLRTGSRSTLTAVVGGLATIVLVGLLVWLALLTRRIVNVPLLVATAITAGLTYVSLNPSALPLDIDQRVDDASRASQALQDVRLARAAQYAQTVDVDEGRGAVEQATQSLTTLGHREVSEHWRAVWEGQDDLDAAGAASEGLTAIGSTQDSFEAAESTLVELVDTRLNDSVNGVGRPALVTSGLALVLGLIAAGLAWTGLTQRLRDYR